MTLVPHKPGPDSDDADERSVTGNSEGRGAADLVDASISRPIDADESTGSAAVSNADRNAIGEFLRDYDPHYKELSQQMDALQPVVDRLEKIQVAARLLPEAVESSRTLDGLLENYKKLADQQGLPEEVPSSVFELQRSIRQSAVDLREYAQENGYRFPAQMLEQFQDTVDSVVGLVGDASLLRKSNLSKHQRGNLQTVAKDLVEQTNALVARGRALGSYYFFELCDASERLKTPEVVSAVVQFVAKAEGDGGVEQIDPQSLPFKLPEPTSQIEVPANLFADFSSRSKLAEREISDEGEPEIDLDDALLLSVYRSNDAKEGLTFIDGQIAELAAELQKQQGSSQDTAPVRSSSSDERDLKQLLQKREGLQLDISEHDASLQATLAKLVESADSDFANLGRDLERLEELQASLGGLLNMISSSSTSFKQNKEAGVMLLGAAKHPLALLSSTLADANYGVAREIGNSLRDLSPDDSSFARLDRTLCAVLAQLHEVHAEVKEVRDRRVEALMEACKSEAEDLTDVKEHDMATAQQLGDVSEQLRKSLAQQKKRAPLAQRQIVFGCVEDSLQQAEGHLQEGDYIQAHDYIVQARRLLQIGEHERGTLEELIQQRRKTPLGELKEEAKGLRNREYYDRAILMYQVVVEREGAKSSAWYNLGVCYWGQGRPAEAAAAYENATERNPADGQAFNNLGQAYEALGRGAEAQKAYWRSLEAKKPSRAAHSNLGALCLAQNDLAAAETHFQDAIAIHPKNPKALHGLGQVAMRRGELAEALEYFGKAYRLDSKKIEYSTSLEECFRRLKPKSSSSVDLDLSSDSESNEEQQDV